MGNDAVFLMIGDLAVHWNGVLIMLAVAAGIILACRMRVRQGMGMDDMLIAALGSMAAGLVGARIYYCWNASEYFSGIKAMLDLTNGGYALYGALAGAFVATLITALVRKVSPGQLLDAQAPGLALAIAIGRWGAAFTGENLGDVTERLTFFPFAVYSEVEKEWRSSLFLYQSLIAAVLCVVLVMLVSRRYVQKTAGGTDGNIYMMFLLCYSLTQGIFEIYRADRLYFHPLFIVKLKTVPISLAVGAVVSAAVLSVFILRAMFKGGLKLNPGTIWPVFACAAGYLCCFNVTLRFPLSDTLAAVVAAAGAAGLILTGAVLYRNEALQDAPPQKTGMRRQPSPAKAPQSSASYWD